MAQTYIFSPAEFFNTTYNTGHLYNYQYEIPTINLVKVHGSMNWEISGDTIIQSITHLDRAEEFEKAKQKDDFINCFSVVLPQKDKFRETVLNQINYDLFRIYANELDKENTLLLVDGFSFADEHISSITERALKNPTLQLVVFCYSEDDFKGMVWQFGLYENVDICYNKGGNLKFSDFTSFISDCCKTDYVTAPEETTDGST
jgi:hypothetical protein